MSSNRWANSASSAALLRTKKSRQQLQQQQQWLCGLQHQQLCRVRGPEATAQHNLHVFARVAKHSLTCVPPPGRHTAAAAQHLRRQVQSAVAAATAGVPHGPMRSRHLAYAPLPACGRLSSAATYGCIAAVRFCTQICCHWLCPATRL